MTDAVIYDEREDWIDSENACPKCGERRIDYLVWDEDDDVVRCASCGATYKPGGEA